MDTKSIQRLMVRILSVSIVLLLAFSSFGAGSAEEIPNPHFIVFPEWDFFDGLDWPDGATVYISVEGKPECYLERESWGGFFNGNFPEGCDIVIGDTVQMNDGGTFRTHVVRNLAVTGVDKDENIVAGTADEGVQVDVWVHGIDGMLHPIADEGGAWLADFDDLKIDLVEGMSGRSQINDEAGNATAVDWYVPNPHFTVFPEWEFFDALDWPDGATVYISVGGKPECYLERESWGGFFNGNFPEGCDIVIGDTVQMNDGGTFRTHVVRNLAVTGVDKDENTVAGTADEGVQVDVWVHGIDGMLHPIADEGGAWLADFDDLKIDLVEGMSGRSQVYDDLGNATAVDWYIPNPHFIVFPEWEFFDALEWPAGATVSISVEGKPECSLERQSPGDFFNGNFPEGCDVAIGDTVQMNDGVTFRSHMVQLLAVTAIDAAADTVAGTADRGAVVQVWPHGIDLAPLNVTAELDGSWLADFSGLYNLAAGKTGRSQITDEVGNATAVDWMVPLYGWEQVNSDGFGDPSTSGVTALELFRGKLYAGTYNGNTGGQVWGLREDGEWLPVSETGFGYGSMNPAIIDLVTFQGQLYAGTGWGESPGQVWRTKDGPYWQQVTVDGFGDGENIGITNFVAFKGMLYAGTGNPSASAQIWRSSSGKPGSWTQVAPEDSGFPGNVTGFAIYNDVLYAAIEPPSPEMPAQVWRSTDGSSWSTVVADGFGDAGNVSTGGFGQFGGYLYLGTRNDATGGQLWRTSNGTDWEQVVSDGFGDTRNIKLESLYVYDNLFHAVTYNDQMGLQIWNTADGMNWDQILADGFGDSANYSTLWNNATIKAEGGMLIGTWNTTSGGELWMFTHQPPPPPSPLPERTVTAGNFVVVWSQTNPEDIVSLSWNGSDNLTNTWIHPACVGDSEFFGNSWVSEGENTPDFFFATLVGWGTTGTWASQATKVNIDSISSGCPGSAEIPVLTSYKFFDEPDKANLIKVDRTFEFGDISYTHDVRPFIPRLYPSDGFTEVIHPDASGTALETDTTCVFGCTASSWDGSWFAIHNPDTGLGMIVQRVPSSFSVALWLDNDAGSFTNASSILLLQPSGGFTGTVTETEYLCFYDSSLWEPSLTLPSGCQP